MSLEKYLAVNTKSSILVEGGGMIAALKPAHEPRIHMIKLHTNVVNWLIEALYWAAPQALNERFIALNRELARFNSNQSRNTRC